MFVTFLFLLELLLFTIQEAYRMVNVAEERSRNAERLLAEARLKVDMLEDEVLGLKRIVVDQNYHHHNIFTTPIKQQFSLSRSALVQRFLNNSCEYYTLITAVNFFAFELFLSCAHMLLKITSNG